jgi:small subunit ribosomal protein S4
MARNLKEKCKQCRREGVKLFLKADRCNSPKCAMVKRNFPPGVHGSNGYPRTTGYGQQLREKQKVKRIYRILEKQMENYFKKASKARGNTEEALLQGLEMRFDNVIYRIGLAKSRDLARQLISHGHFAINNKRVNIASYQLKIGDVISIQAKSKEIKPLATLKEQLKGKESLSWLYLDSDKMQIKVTGKPSLAESRGEFDLKLIIEFYSK